MALTPALPDAGSRHDVVHVQPDPDPAITPTLAQRRDEERGRIDEMRRKLNHQLAFQQRLAHEPEIEVLQVAKAAVDHLRRAARGADGVVVALHQGHRVAPGCRVERHTRSRDPATDDDDVEAVRAESLEGVGAGEHQSR